MVRMVPIRLQGRLIIRKYNHPVSEALRDRNRQVILKAVLFLAMRIGGPRPRHALLALLLPILRPQRSYGLAGLPQLGIMQDLELFAKLLTIIRRGIRL